jgi:broad specificity phosphatase PhoE
LKKIYFVRHGQSEWNAVSRMQGQLDSNLTEAGRRQAEVTGRLLATLDIEAIFSSPLDRARQTAEIIQRDVAVDIVCEPRIKEWDCGDWSGHLYVDVQRRWPTEWAALEADRFHYRGPGCENYVDMIDRAQPFLDELLATPAERVAIVSHGMIGRVMIGILMGHSEAEMLSFHQPNDTVYRVSIDGDVRQVHHYVAGRGPVAGLRASR